MEIISEGMPSTAPAPQSLPRFADGTINMQELIRSMAEMLTNEIMSAEADQLCESTGNSRNGYRERKLVTCVGTLTLRIPKLRSGSFFPEDVIERYQRVDRAVAAAVNEMYATGTSTRKVAKVAAAMGIERLSKDQVSAMVSGLDADNEELLGRDLSGLRMPYLWLDATYVKCRTGAHVASVAVVTAIGCDEDGWRHVLGLDVVDTESHDSWLGFLQGLRARGVHGVELVTSDAHTGLKGAIAEVFQGAAWQRCVVHLIRNCTREAGRGSLARRVARIVAPVFRAKDADTVRAMYHVACEIAGGLLPQGRGGPGGGRARRPGLPRLPPEPLEKAQDQQRPGAHQPRDQAPEPRRAGVPLGEVPAQAGGGGDVRPRRGLVGGEVLQGVQDGAAVRASGRDRGAAVGRAAGAGARLRAPGDRGEPRACRRDGGGIE